MYIIYSEPCQRATLGENELISTALNMVECGFLLIGILPYKENKVQ